LPVKVRRKGTKLIADISTCNILTGRCTLRNADCGMQNFEKVYFAEFHLRNVPQITPESFFRIPHCAKFK